MQNLNRDPVLALADNSFDAAMICVSIQYLQQPVAVLREVGRVLRPGAPLVISFSNRCFWTKAVAIWRALDDDGHARLVERYLHHAGFEQIAIHRLAEWVEDVSDPMTCRGRPRSRGVGWDIVSSTPSCLTGEGRYPWPKWVPACAGMTIGNEPICAGLVRDKV